MRRFLLSLCFLAAVCVSGRAQIRFTPNPAMPLPEGIHLYMNSNPDYDGRFSFMAPSWFIYPDKPCTREEAEALVDEMGLNDALKPYCFIVAVLGPADGKAYDKEKDRALYEQLINRLRVHTNLKVVGIGSGATFVNEVIAPMAWEVAGIVSLGGKAPKKAEGEAVVPAYLGGKDAAKAGKVYAARDKALLQEDGKTLKVYRNAEEPLLQVVVNTQKNLSLKESMADAWERLLSRNYRCSNLGHTSYMGGTIGQFGNYELEPYLMWDRIGTTRRMVTDTLFTYNRTPQKYLWYEYVPRQLATAPEASMPLVILLHGHNNDPRTQAETSGFVELGAEEGFFVAELEWQGKEGVADYMGDHGIEAVIRELLRKYPQLDPSRVYAEGLSAGGFTVTALGARKPYLFAAVGSHSGGVCSESLNLGFPFMDPPALKLAARANRGKIQMPYFSICGTADDAVPFVKPELPQGEMVSGAWRLYQELNGLEVSGPTDLEKYPVFGLPLQNRHRIETIKPHAMEVGDLLNAAGQPVIRLVAVENFGHWNFVPGARQMWEFFRCWRRDPKTLESVYVPTGQDTGYSR